MKKIVIVGAGFAGHSAALYLGDKLGKKHAITMIHGSDSFVYTPAGSKAGMVTFKLAPVYKRVGAYFIEGVVTAIHVDEDEQHVLVKKKNGDLAQVEYDHLVIAQHFSDMPAAEFPIKYLSKGHLDVTEKVVDKSGFVLVDSTEDSPSRYQNSNYRNILAVGSALQDTGTDTDITGYIIAHNIIELVENTSTISSRKMRPVSAWTKRVPRGIFLWKLRALPGWKIIPE